MILGTGDMLRPALTGVVLRGIGLSLLLLVALQAVVTAAIRAFAPETLTLPWLGEIGIGAALSWGSLALLPVMGMLLMVPVAAAICGIYSDRVAGAVEAAHYPWAKGRDVPLTEGLAEAARLVLATLAVSLGSLLLSPVLGPAAPILFYLGNGWLIGREYFHAVAIRHMPGPEASALRRSLGLRVTAAGAAVTVLLTLPLLGIAVPVLATAIFTHLVFLSGGSARPSPARPRG
nr:EI24 domain-containing protein [Paracoccus sp. S-4012]